MLRVTRRNPGQRPRKGDLILAAHRRKSVSNGDSSWRVLHLFARRGLIMPGAAAEMRQCQHGVASFSLDTGIRIEAAERKGLARRVGTRNDTTRVA